MATLNSSYQKVGESYCGNGGGTNVYIRLYAKLNFQSIANNNSSINLQTRVYFSGNLQTSAVKCTTDGTSIAVVSGMVSYSKGNEYTLQTVSRTVGHKSDGTSGTISKSCAWSSYYSSVNGGTSGSFTLPTIPRQATLKSAPNFNDDSNLTIKYSNPAGNAVTALEACVSLTGATDDITYRSISKTGTSYTFNFTDEERKILRSACANSNSLNVKPHVRTKIGNNTYYSSLTNTMTIVNANPTFSNFTYKDTNSVVTTVTGNDQVLVKGLSTLQVTISSANKMIAKKEATAKKYVATIDSINRSANYSTSDLNINLGTPTFSGTKRLNVRAYDSRNNSTLAYKDIIIYDYNKPVINASVTRLNNFENQTILKISGTYSKLTIDDTDKNVVTQIQYRYRESGGTYSNWETLTSTISGGKFSCDDVILSFDNTKAFDFEIQAIDNLGTTTKKLKLDVGNPIFMISSNKKTIYKNNDEILSGCELLGYGETYKGDLNDAPLGTIYSNSNANQPPPYVNSTTNAFVTTFSNAAGSIKFQIFYRYRDNEVWIRNYNTNLEPSGWKSWKRIDQNTKNLYSNSTGSTSSVTLSENASNYNSLMIELTPKQYIEFLSIKYITIVPKNGKFSDSTSWYNSSNKRAYMLLFNYTIADNKITITLNQGGSVGTDTAYGGEKNVFAITKVIGFGKK